MDIQPKKRPIIVPPDMVKAILDGRKTMFRKILKCQPEPPRGIYNENDAIPILEEFGDELLLRFNWRTERYYPKIHENASFFDGRSQCPYGKVSDILWLREIFSELYDTCDHPELPGATEERWSLGYRYKADNYVHQVLDGFWTGWRSPIHMPKEACRLILRINAIRVERLQDISEEDAIAEGIDRNHDGHWRFYTKKKLRTVTAGCQSAKDSFLSLWTSINGSDSWIANPWVWVVSFERINNI